MTDKKKPKKDFKKTVEKESVDLVKAQLALEKDKEKRVARAKVRIDAVLVEERCALVPTIVLSQGRQQDRIDIVAVD